MKKPVLIIMAAGMGSRYGGMKQIDPVDGQGHILMDFSLYDARRAGFEKVIFIIKRENERLFREAVGDRVSRQMEVSYAFQELSALPDGFAVPEGRVKPWGTGHAVLAAMDQVDGPFAVINADDYYGPKAFSLIYDYLSAQPENGTGYAMVGYILKNTVTENGHVARGICRTDNEGMLQGITERTMIMKTASGTAYSEDGGAVWTDISPESLVSMNMWGFTAVMMRELKARFPVFLEKTLREDPVKGEYFLPFVVDELLKEGRAQVKVLRTPDKWYGMTYREDRQAVREAIEGLKKQGLYPREF